MRWWPHCVSSERSSDHSHPQNGNSPISMPFPHPRPSFLHSPTSFPRRRESHSRVRRASIAMPAQTHRTARFAFDKTEPAYYPRTMTTPSKPRPRGDSPMRETSKLPTASLRAPNRHLSFHSQSPRAPRGDTKLAVSKILQNATESDEPLRKLVRARARGNGIPFPSSRHMDCAQVAAPGVIPTKAGIFSRRGLRPRRNGFLESPSYIPPCQ